MIKELDMEKGKVEFEFSSIDRAYDMMSVLRSIVPFYFEKGGRVYEVSNIRKVKVIVEINGEVKELYTGGDNSGHGMG